MKVLKTDIEYLITGYILVFYDYKNINNQNLAATVLIENNTVLFFFG